MTASEDPEATLVTPRFDADEARHAHPVVPLSEAPAPYSNASRRRGPRRVWTPALLAVALLAAAALGGAFAMRFMQSPRAEQTQEQTPEETQSAPAQTAEAPQQQPSTPAVAEATRVDAPADRPATSEARPRRSRTAAVAPAVVEPAPEAADENDEGEHRGRKDEKRREREDEVEKEMRRQMDKALKRSKGKAPRLVDVLTNP